MSDMSVLHNFPQWEKLNKDIADDEFDYTLYEQLILHHEKLITDHKELVQSRKELKSLLYADMDRLVTRFPYCTSFWKRYVQIVNTLDGLLASSKILHRAITMFPYSLELWIDYINIILANRLETEERVKELFVQGSNQVGYCFLSDGFWDIYLNWIKSRFGVNSLDYIALLLKIIRLPLHQYAKYFDEFTKRRQNFTIHDLIEKDDLVGYINRQLDNAEVPNYDEYIDANSEALIENYFQDLLQEVQNRVQTKWNYENSIKTDFDMSLLGLKEMNQWQSYLDYEEAYQKSQKKEKNNIEIITLYERALIPTCMSDKIWIRFNRYLIQNGGDSNRIVLNFNRACDQFVPSNLKNIRYMYIKYLELKLQKIEQCKALFVSMIEKRPSDAEIVSRYIDFLIENENESSRAILLQDIVNCVHNYNRKIGQEEHVDRKKKVKNTDGPIKIVSEDIAQLSSLLNFWTVGQLVVNVCKYHWLIKKDTTYTRDILMSFFKTAATRSSRSFLYFFFKFETCQRNKKNLAHIIEYVKLSSTLSVSDINFLIAEYNSFIFKNFTVTEMKQNGREIVKNILETDFESSFHMKHFLKCRLAGSSDVEMIDKKILKENGHPAASCDGRPTLINPILITDNIHDSENAYQLPRFRNVEKASLNVKYIHESL